MNILMNKLDNNVLAGYLSQFMHTFLQVAKGSSE